MAHSIALGIVGQQLLANRLPEIGGRRVVHGQSLLWFIRIDSIPNFGAPRHVEACERPIPGHWFAAGTPLNTNEISEKRRYRGGGADLT